MNIPSNLRYTNEHEWIRVEGEEAYVGITDYAQSELGEIVFVDVPTIGEEVAQGEVFGSIEAVKTVSDLNIPVTGEVLAVEGTPFDFRTPKPVGRDIAADDEQIKNGTGYDHCYVLNKHEPGELTLAASMVEPSTGRTMECWTTEPGVQFYSDNWADGYKGQHGATFGKHSGLCFEAQHFPDSPTRAHFPSTQLKPGDIYVQKTVYKFGIDK